MTAVVVAGLPNIMAKFTPGSETFNSGFGSLSVADGAFALEQLSEQRYIYPNSTYKFTCNSLNLDASKSNSIYGSSETVQPPALQMIAQIKY